MKKINFKKNFFAVALTVAVSLLVLVSCAGGNEEIEDLLDRFEDTCNSLNINLMLDYIDPDVAAPVKLSMSVLNELSGGESDEVMKKLAATLITGMPKDVDAFLRSIDIEAERIKVKGDTATVDAVVEYEMADVDFEKRATFECIRVSDGWYISGMSLN